MILIFSSTKDQATNAVVGWLDRLSRPFVRVNEDDPCRSTRFTVDLDNSGFSVCDGDARYVSSDIEAVWYRKGNFFPLGIEEAPHFPDDPGLGGNLARKLPRETEVAARYFQHLISLRTPRVLGNAFLGDPNKLITLHQAQSVGLKVPSFNVTNMVGDQHIHRSVEFITKSLSNGIYYWDEQGSRKGYFSYTESLDDAIGDLHSGDRIPISLIQEKIAKKFEVRIFYLDGAFAACAIISQNDLQTSVDFRKYNYANPNRNIPINIPVETKLKIKNLFELMSLNTGSVDMIVDEHGDYVFLEINPFGVYGSQTAVCGFNIDEGIARWLSGEEVTDETFTNGALERAIG